MKIIVEGDANKRQPVRFACKYCGCVFDADRTEYEIAEESIDADCIGAIFKVVTIYSHKCPCCDRTVMAREERKL